MTISQQLHCTTPNISTCNLKLMNMTTSGHSLFFHKKYGSSYLARPEISVSYRKMCCTLVGSRYSLCFELAEQHALHVDFWDTGTENEWTLSKNQQMVS